MIDIDVVAIASALAGNDLGDSKGPVQLQNSEAFKQHLGKNYGIHLHWQHTIYALAADTVTVSPLLDNKTRSIQSVIQQCFAATKTALSKPQPFLFIGGDHAEAMGIWAAVRDYLPANKCFKLLWLDAHMDAHNTQTSCSGNIHGMPVQALLGSADKQLKSLYHYQTHLNAEEILLCGIRSFEAPELAFLQQQKVEIIYSKDMPAACVDQAETATAATVAAIIGQIKHKLDDCDYFGISIDLDVLDPSIMPAISCPEPEGLSLVFMQQLLASLGASPRFIGAEIAEYTSSLDQDKQGEFVVAELIAALFNPVKNHTSP